MKFYRRFGRVLVAVRGTNLDAFLNRIVQADLEIDHVKKADNLNLTLCINWRNLDKLIDLFRGSCYTLSVIKFYGLPRLYNFLGAHLGLVVGLSLACISLVVLSQFVWRVEITGCERLEAKAVRQQLASLGLTTGVFIPSLNSKSLELEVKQAFGEVSLISISVRGTTVVVNLVESIDYTSIEEDESKAILASHDGQITSILVLEGTAVVRVGDSVVAGQTLIAPYVVDADGQINPCKARGEVMANVWYAHTMQFSTSVKNYVRTGNSVTATSLSVFGSTFVLRNPENPYADFEVEQRTVYQFNNNFVPIKLTYITYYETMPVVVTIDYDSEIDSFKYEAKILAMETVPSNLAILDERFSIKLVENTYYVTVYLKTRQIVSKGKREA